MKFEEDSLCLCFKVAEAKVREAIIKNKLTTLEEVMQETEAGMGCGGCHSEIEDLLKEING